MTFALPLVVESWRQSWPIRRRGAIRRRSGLGPGYRDIRRITCVSCCSPPLLPALIGLFGASGTALLSVNVTLHQWFVPLALLALVTINGRTALVLPDLVRGCRIKT